MKFLHIAVQEVKRTRVLACLVSASEARGRVTYACIIPEPPDRHAGNGGLANYTGSLYLNMGLELEEERIRLVEGL